MKNSLILTLLLCFIYSMAHADGIIIPEPRADLAIKYHRVNVEITDQATTTEIDQVFLNEARFDVEGTYIFPIPKGASFSALSMYVDGKPLEAEILEADEARRIYEEIVRKRIDPALLEYVGQGAYRARIYPIPGKGEKRVQLSYDEVLEHDNGVCRYRYPLNTEKFSSKPLEDVSVSIDLRSSAPIKSVYSPSHKIAVEKIDDHHVKVIYAEENVRPEEDFVLYYSLSDDEVGIHLLTYLESAADDPGFYMLLASPKAEIEERQIAKKRMIFLLDTSGSMSGEKIDQAKEALKFALNHLNEGDEFNIVDYSTDVRIFSKEPLPANADNVSPALNYVDKLQANGGTNINRALLTGLGFLQDDDFTNMAVFLTDGKPTVEVTDNEEILKNVREANESETRIFVFGVGEGVNTHLLDKLSLENHGISTYVLPDEDIELTVSSFYAKVSNPVLANLSLHFDGAEVEDFYPQELPDLFHGAQLVQLGRFNGTGQLTIRLSGERSGTPLSFERSVPLDPDPSASGRREKEFLPRLWATRKVGYLLDQIRLHGEEQELVDEIIALSKRYGIITPYTSFLIVEDQPPPVVFQEKFRAESGADALNVAREVKSYGGATDTQDIRDEGVKYAGDKTFFFRNGFWKDSAYKEDDPTLNYIYGTEAYFSLLAAHPELGRYFAIGKNLIVAFEGRNYRIGEHITEVEEHDQAPSLPEGFRLNQNYPNPFNPSTTISFMLPSFGAWMEVELAIFDLMGQKIRSLLMGQALGGTFRVFWDGKDGTGRSVSSGVYLYRLRVGDGKWVKTKKMVLIR